jgi:hypothetical protein
MIAIVKRSFRVQNPLGMYLRMKSGFSARFSQRIFGPVDTKPHQRYARSHRKPFTFNVSSITSPPSPFAPLREFFCSPFFAFFALFRGYSSLCLRACV